MSNRYEIITSNIINAASAPADLGVAINKLAIPGVPVQPGALDIADASINLLKAGAAILDLCKKVPGLSTFAAVTSLGFNLTKASLEINGENRRITTATQVDLVSDFFGNAAAVAVASIGATSTAPVWVSLGILLATAGIASSIYSSTIGVQDKQETRVRSCIPAS